MSAYVSGRNGRQRGGRQWADGALGHLPRSHNRHVHHPTATSMQSRYNLSPPHQISPNLAKSCLCLATFLNAFANNRTALLPQAMAVEAKARQPPSQLRIIGRRIIAFTPDDRLTPAFLPLLQVCNGLWPSRNDTITAGVERSVTALPTLLQMDGYMAVTWLLRGCYMAAPDGRLDLLLPTCSLTRAHTAHHDHHDHQAPSSPRIPDHTHRAPCSHPRIADACIRGPCPWWHG